MTILTPTPKYYVLIIEASIHQEQLSPPGTLCLVLGLWFMAMVGKQRKVKNNSKILETALIFHLLRAFSYFEIAIN